MILQWPHLGRMWHSWSLSFLCPDRNASDHGHGYQKPLSCEQTSWPHLFFRKYGYGINDYLLKSSENDFSIAAFLCSELILYQRNLLKSKGWILTVCFCQHVLIAYNEVVILVDINSSIVCGCHLGTLIIKACVDLYLNWICLLKTEQKLVCFVRTGRFVLSVLLDCLQVCH